MVQDSHTSAAGSKVTSMHADSRSALTDPAALLLEVGMFLVMEAYLSDLPVLSCKFLHVVPSIWALVTEERLHMLVQGQPAGRYAILVTGNLVAPLAEK